MYNEIRALLEEAMKDEIIAAACYRKAARKMEDDDVRELLIDLASNEEQHYQDLSKKYQIYSNRKMFYYEVQPVDLKPVESLAASDYAGILDHGIQQEKQAVQFYSQAAQKVADDSVLASFFRHLEAIECKHVADLSSLRKKHCR